MAVDYKDPSFVLKIQSQLELASLGLSFEHQEQLVEQLHLICREHITNYIENKGKNHK